jgi:cytochrome P450
MIHYNPQVWPDPQKYDPLRFADPSAIPTCVPLPLHPIGFFRIKIPTSRWTLHHHNFPASSTHALSRYAFLPFGAGMHACPGRNFAMQVIKMAVANILSKYHVALKGPRPKHRYMVREALLSVF